MTSYILLSVLLAGPAFAAIPCKNAAGLRTSPCMPVKAEQHAVMGKIDAALIKEAKWRDRRTTEDELREALEETKRRGGNPSLRELEAWHDSLTKLNEAEGEMRRAFSGVLNTTQDSYGVGPKKRLGTIKGGHLDAQQTVWAPVIQENEDLVYRSGSAQNPAYLRWQEAAGDGAATMDDGMVFVSVELLRTAKRHGSPAVLAAMIDHEAAHFEALVSKEGWTGFDSGQYRAYLRQETTGAAIGLEESEQKWAESQRKDFAGRAVFREMWPGYRAEPGSDDYPYRKDKDIKENFETWKGAQKRLAEIVAQRDDFNARLAARHQGEPDEGMRDSLNGSRHSCGGAGSWAGGVYLPSFPCEGTVRSSPEEAPTLPAGPPAVVRPVQPPAYAAPIYLLSALAARICADPSTAHDLANHEAYRRGLVLSGEDGNSMTPCQREVFQTLRKIQREGFGDYDSQYFQSLAESPLNPPLEAPPEGPNPSGPPGAQGPESARRDGGRCLQWRRR